MNYQRWIGPNEWGQSIPIPQRKGSFAKWGRAMFMWKNLKTDHGGKEYKDIDWALKINERAIAKNMPLLREFDNYEDWGPIP